MEQSKHLLTDKELNDLIELADLYSHKCNVSSILNALLELKQLRAEGTHYIMDASGVFTPLKPGQIVLIKR